MSIHRPSASAISAREPEITKIFTAAIAVLFWGLLATDGQAQTVLISSPAQLQPNATTIVDQATGSPVPLATARITVHGTTLTINGRFTIASLIIERNEANEPGLVTHAAGAVFDYSGGANSDVVYGLNLTTSSSVSIQGPDGALVGSSLDVSGRGYAAGEGPGAGQNGVDCCTTGGGYGGNGGAGRDHSGGGLAYGSVDQPSDLGSGGGITSGYGPDGAGGGSVRLTVNGTLTVGGTMNADGAAGGFAASSGSGGSILITASTLTGTGTIHADGGSCGQYGGGGGGGRVALHGGINGFAGTTSASGGTTTNAVNGGAGTIWKQQTGQNRGDIIIDNGGSDTITPTPVGTTANIRNVTVKGGAFGTLASGTLFNGVLTLDGAHSLELTSPQSFESLAVLNGSTLTHKAGNQTGLQLTVSQGITIDATSSVDVSGRGYAAGEGPGAGQNGVDCCTTGGGYGGNGGAGRDHSGGGLAYGSVDEPSDLGSGGGITNGYGPDGAGGGSVRLTVNGTLTISGTMNADGAAGGFAASAGSGGSILITASTLTGTGTIHANGGNCGQYGGGGGGGRVALHGGINGFAGTTSASGGTTTNAANGGAGTIWKQQTGQSWGDIIIDSGGPDTTTPTPLATIANIRNLTVSGGAFGKLASGTLFSGVLTLDGAHSLELTSPQSFESLVVLNGSTLTHETGNQTGLQLTVSQSATIDATSSVDVSGRGYAAGEGPGAGQNGVDCCTTGGGYGGNGGAGRDHSGGGLAYGSVDEPTDLGSGGGITAGYGPSGAGGGSVRLTVNGTLTIGGTMNADGAAGGFAASAGSGGSILITASTLTGTGTIHANGGNCGQFGGGGGGGRVALYSCDQQIGGSNIVVLGGVTTDAVDGAPGTVFLRTNPIITSEPASGSVCSQTQAVLAVRAIGPGLLTYQWQLRPTGGSSFTDVVDGDNSVDGGQFTASGANAPTLILSSGTLTAGNFEFRCEVSNGCGATESHTASFRVCAADYNCDGTLNADDLSDFITGYFNNPADATTDFNQDGVINADDLGDFITAYFNGC